MMSGQKVPRSVEQRIVIKFLVGENVPSAEIHHRLQQQYGEVSPTQSAFQEARRRFLPRSVLLGRAAIFGHEEDHGFEDGPRTGRPFREGWNGCE